MGKRSFLIPQYSVNRRPKQVGGTARLGSRLQVLLIAICASLPIQAADQDQSALASSRLLEAEAERLRAELGAMHPALREVLESLAAHRESTGDYQQAASLWYQVFEIERSNSGLESQTQLPFLYRLIETLMSAGEWEQVDDYHHLAFHIASRNWSPDSPEYIGALHQLTSWRLRAWQQGLLSRGTMHVVEEPHLLRELRELYQQSLATRYDDANEWMIDMERLELLYGRALIELETIHHLIRIPIWLREPQQPRYIRQEVCSNVRTPGGGSQRICSIQQVPNPEYRAGVREEERIRIDRANQRLAQSLTEIERLKPMLLSDDQSAVHEEWPASYQQRLADLREAAEAALLESRQAATRNW